MPRYIKKLFSLFGIRISKVRPSPPPPSYLEALMKGCLLIKKTLNIVQIGANDGKVGDPLYSFLMNNKKFTKALLIEPQSEIIPFLEKNYNNHPKITIFNGAIGTSQNLTLFRIKPSLWEFFDPPHLKSAPRYRVASGITSSNKEYIINAVEKYLQYNIPTKEALEKIEVRCKQLESLLLEVSFDGCVDVIQVDAEGSDDDVIYACNIEKIKPLIINYEYKHLNSIKDAKLEEYLQKNNYEVIPWNNSDKVAILRLR